MPSTDPRFLDATHDEIMADYYAHLYYEDPKAAEIDEDDDFDPDAVESLLKNGNPDDWEDVK